MAEAFNKVGLLIDSAHLDHQMVRKILPVAAAVVLVLLILFLINRFIFSWGGLLLSTVNLCVYKSVAVPTDNGADKTLAQSYQLHEIAAVMKAKGNYDVNERASGGQGLVISRIF